jgi:hypothetical protein
LPGTADEITQSLRTWIEGVLAGSTVKLLGATDPTDENGISLRLINAAPLATPRTDRPSYTLRLDYLVTISADDPLRQHKLVGELLFAAMASGEYELMPAKGVAEAATHADAPRGGSLVLSAKLRREPPERAAPLVTEPLVVNAEHATPLAGVVVGPSDHPIADAVVEIPALGLSELTDAEGRFRFVRATAGNAAVRLVVRKHRHRVDVEAVPGRDLIIHIPMEG